MIISFHQKFIFIAIPKTAGHAIRRALRPALAHNDWEQCTLFEKQYFPVESLASVGHGHITCQQIAPFLLPGMWDTFFKFCFVRNPYDRFVSYCFFMNRANQRMQENPTAMMKAIIQDPAIHQQILFRPQYEFVTNEAGQLLLDYVGKYESLQSEYDDICHQIGIAPTTLSEINASLREAYWCYFDAELKEMVYAFYRRDFELFGYRTALT